MDIIEPRTACVVSLFRALHAYHAAFDPSTYHCEGPDEAYHSILDAVCADGGRVFAHDADWGLVSYILARPEWTARSPLRNARRFMVIEHLYVAPAFRDLGLSRELIARVEAWARVVGCDGWLVSYHYDNPGADDVYEAFEAPLWKGMRRKSLV